MWLDAVSAKGLVEADCSDFLLQKQAMSLRNLVGVTFESEMFKSEVVKL